MHCRPLPLFECDVLYRRSRTGSIDLMIMRPVLILIRRNCAFQSTFLVSNFALTPHHQLCCFLALATGPTINFVAF